jgi:hypothetical protein
MLQCSKTCVTESMHFLHKLKKSGNSNLNFDDDTMA